MNSYGFKTAQGVRIKIDRRSQVMQDGKAQQEIAQHRDQPFVCLCRSDMNLILWAAFLSVEKLFYLRRDHANDPHSELCPFNRFYDQNDERPRFSPSIFLAPVNNSKGSGGSDRKALSARYESFNYFARDLISTSSVQAFNRLNRGKALGGGLRMPSGMEFCREFYRTLRSAVLSDGSKAFDAAQARQVELNFGFIDGPLLEISRARVAETFAFAPHALFGREGRRKEAFHLSTQVAAQLKGHFSIGSNIVGPPYFFVISSARLAGRSQIQRIFAYPVTSTSGFDARPVVFVESGRERAFAECGLSQNRIFVKETRLGELGLLDPAFLGRTVPWKARYRPDIMDVTDNALRIYEIGGFEEDGYVKDLARKKTYFEETIGVSVTIISPAEEIHAGMKWPSGG